ncbi:MAG: FAD-dependent oxidoreductase, partial [Myxococcota bacterium]
QTLLARYATYNGSDVRHAPATLNCIAHVELTLGGYGVDGGLYHVAQTLTELARAAGAEFRLGTRVTDVLTQRNRVTGVQLATGERCHADVVVSNADVQHLFNDLMPSTLQDPGPPEAPSMSGWNAVIRRTRRPGRAPHTVLFPENYLAEFEAIFDHRQVPEEPTIYLCDQAATHNRSGWSDADPLFVMINAPAVHHGGSLAEHDWEAVQAQVVERITHAGLMEATDPVVWTRTPQQLAERFPGSKGSLYGAASNSMWSAFLRPANRANQVEGLYLASGTVHPGGGVPMCMLSGMAASRAALTDLGFGQLSQQIAV